MSARCNESNRIVPERRYVRQMGKCSWSFWRRPALGPQRPCPSARGRRLRFRSCRSPRTLRRADLDAIALKSSTQFARELDCARCIAVDTNGFATYGHIAAFDGTHLAFAQHPQHAFAATALAVYLHGLAGDLASESVGENSLVATDLLRVLPQAFAEMRKQKSEEVRIHG